MLVTFVESNPHFMLRNYLCCSLVAGALAMAFVLVVYNFADAVLYTSDTNSVLALFWLLDRLACNIMVEDMHRVVVVLASSLVVPCHT